MHSLSMNVNIVRSSSENAMSLPEKHVANSQGLDDFKTTNVH